MFRSIYHYPDDLVLQAVGRTPSGENVAADRTGVAETDRGYINVDIQMRTKVPNIFAIGTASYLAAAWRHTQGNRDTVMSSEQGETMGESIQKKLLRTNPVRGHLTYDVEKGGALEKRELPFVIGVYADLSGDQRPATAYKERRMLQLDRENFDAVFKACAPGVDLSGVDCVLPGAASASLAGMLRFESLTDFEPAAVLARVEEICARMASGHTPEVASQQLSLILRSAAFQALEATWLSLHRLVTRIETGPLLQVRVFNATRQELFDDVIKAVDFDQSLFFKLIYEAEYGTYGGSPYSLLLGAYEFDSSHASIDGLKQIAEVAAAAHAPFVAAASVSFFGLSDFSHLGKPRSLLKMFESADLAGWQAFRESKDAAYVSLVLPRVLLRVPAGVHERLLWGNPAFMLAECIALAFQMHGWPAAFTGVQSGGVVDGLCSLEVESAEGGHMQLGPTEVSIADRRWSELTELGFVALCARKNSDEAVFFDVPSALKPKKYLEADTTGQSKLAAKLPCILAASRLAHYIKVIARDKLGSFLTRGVLEVYLNTWLSQYVMPDDSAAPETKASYPLRQGSVVLTETPGSPGAYQATLLIQPSHQMDQLHTPLRVEIDLPG